jgi:hypothetical protein
MKRHGAAAELSEDETPILFNAEQIGKSLREVAVDVIETEGSTILSRWFHSKHDVELFLWTDGEQNVIKHQVTFYGQVVEWNVFEGVKTGVIVEQENMFGNSSDGDESSDESVSETIQFDKVAEDAAVSRAIVLLSHVSELPEIERKRICDNLKFRVKGEASSNDEFIRRYGEVYGRDQNRRPSFWKRVKRWFSAS